jgi:hypothetical protein
LGNQSGKFCLGIWVPRRAEVLASKTNIPYWEEYFGDSVKSLLLLSAPPLARGRKQLLSTNFLMHANHCARHLIEVSGLTTAIQGNIDFSYFTNVELKAQRKELIFHVYTTSNGRLIL